jgi:hypothetical protein
MIEDDRRCPVQSDPHCLSKDGDWNRPRLWFGQRSARKERTPCHGENFLCLRWHWENKWIRWVYEGAALSLGLHQALLKPFPLNNRLAFVFATISDKYATYIFFGAIRSCILLRRVGSKTFVHSLLGLVGGRKRRFCCLTQFWLTLE